MLILLHILGYLFFGCLIVCCLYFRKEHYFEQYEEYSDYLKTVKLPEYAKTA